jgi:hypothetical protein
MGHKYTEEDEAYVQANYGIIPLTQIAKDLHVSYKAIRAYVRRRKVRGMAIARLEVYKFSAEDDTYIISHYAKGWTARQIGDHLKLPTGKIWQRIVGLREVARVKGDKRVMEALSISTHSMMPKLEVTDGYPDVPWWCRQSTRNQYCATRLVYGE